MSAALLSPRQLADAVGVSVSSVKRWADQGRLRAGRTVGGHRRIDPADAVAFIRRAGLSVVRPDLLGLPGVASDGPDPAAPPRDTTDRLFAALRSGSAAEARAVLVSLLLDGVPVADIVDGPVHGAMARVGELWREGPEGVFLEHRASDLCQHALHHLRCLMAEPAGAPLAVGAAPEHDPFALPSLGAALTLAAEGLRAINLGPDMPCASIVHAVDELRPRLVWLSVSAESRLALVGREVRRLAAQLERRSLCMVLGGRSCRQLDVSGLRNVHRGSSMAELAAFARGLTAAGRV
jgi:excisionase family DNA binding protein